MRAVSYSLLDAILMCADHMLVVLRLGSLHDIMRVLWRDVACACDTCSCSFVNGSASGGNCAEVPLRGVAIYLLLRGPRLSVSQLFTVMIGVRRSLKRGYIFRSVYSDIGCITSYGARNFHSVKVHIKGNLKLALGDLWISPKSLRNS